MAQEGAEITSGYILMILAAALLATAGLLLNSPAAIIGAMCVAPFLGPSRAVCIGGLFRNRKVFVGGLLKQIVDLSVDLGILGELGAAGIVVASQTVAIVQFPGTAEQAGVQAL